MLFKKRETTNDKRIGEKTQAHKRYKDYKKITFNKLKFY